VGPVERHPETERIQAEVLRRLGPQRRLEQMRSLSATVIGLARRAIARARPGSSDEDVLLAFVELQYGRDLAARVRARLQAGR
jgi:hypothetical protein